MPSWLFRPWGCQGLTSLHSNKQKKSRNESSWQTGCTKPRWVCSTQSLIIAEGGRASSGVLVQVSGLSKIGQRVSREAPPRWQCRRNPESRQLGTQPDAESAGSRIFLLSVAGIKTMTKCDLGRKGFNLAYSSVSQSSEGSQGRKWSRCCAWILFTGCFLVACSACSRMEPRTTCPALGPPTAIVNQENAPLLTGPSDGSLFSAEVPSPQITRQTSNQPRPELGWPLAALWKELFDRWFMKSRVAAFCFQDQPCHLVHDSFKLVG